MSYYHQGTNVTFLIFLKCFPANACQSRLSSGGRREVEAPGHPEQKELAHLQLQTISSHLVSQTCLLTWGVWEPWRFLQTYQVRVSRAGA